MMTLGGVRVLVHFVVDFLSQKINLSLPLWYRLSTSKFLTNRHSNFIESRPISYSLADTPDYSWPTVTNQDFFARHLAPSQKYNAKLEQDVETNLDNVISIFKRPQIELQNDVVTQFREGRSNLFFAFFAQWFTDGFFRSSLLDPRQTGANHDVDLCQIYGLDESTARALRSGKNGYLAYQGELGEELPPHLFIEKNGKYELDPAFKDIGYLRKFSEEQQAQSGQTIAQNELELAILKITKVTTEEEFDAVYAQQKPQLLAAGLERGNATVGNLLLNTLFLRCHNRICEDLAKLNEFKIGGQPDDEKIFQAARAINLVLLIKYTIEDYINHLSGTKIFVFDPSYAQNQRWYRRPWLAAEFNLIYRWHGLVPDDFRISENDTIDFREEPSNQLKKYGLETLLQASCKQAAGNIQAGHTPPFLIDADKRMLELGRQWQLASYNEYRKAFGFKPLTSIDKLTKSPRLRAKLKAIYGHIDNVEFVVGIYAEKTVLSQLSGGLLTRMVAYDAFTQLYTNPLVSRKNYTKLMKNPVAKRWVDTTKSLDGLVSKIHGQTANDAIDFVNDRYKGRLNSVPLPIPAKRGAQPTYKPLNNKEDKLAYAQTLCPHLRIGITTENLAPDEKGWVENEELENFLHTVGLKKNSLLSGVLRWGGRTKSPQTKTKQIKLTGFKGTGLDHGSSTGILNCDSGTDAARLKVFKDMADSQENEERLYTENFRLVAKEIHKNPANFPANAGGRYLQLLEFKIILRVYGSYDASRKEYYLSYDDCIRIWQDGKAPKNWVYPKRADIGMGWTIKELCSAYKQYRRNEKQI